MDPTPTTDHLLAARADSTAVAPDAVNSLLAAFDAKLSVSTHPALRLHYPHACTGRRTASWSALAMRTLRTPVHRLAVLIQLGLMVALSLVTILAFGLLRPANRVVYAPKSKYYVNAKQKPPDVGSGFFAWIKPIATIKEDVRAHLRLGDARTERRRRSSWTRSASTPSLSFASSVCVAGCAPSELSVWAALTPPSFTVIAVLCCGVLVRLCRFQGGRPANPQFRFRTAAVTSSPAVAYNRQNQCHLQPPQCPLNEEDDSVHPDDHRCQGQLALCARCHDLCATLQPSGRPT
jgi:hypothetical protein